MRRDHAGSERVLAEMREKWRDDRFIRRRATMALANAASKQGRFREARALMRELQADAEQAGDTSDAFANAVALGLYGLGK